MIDPATTTVSSTGASQSGSGSMHSAAIEKDVQQFKQRMQQESAGMENTQNHHMQLSESHSINQSLVSQCDTKNNPNCLGDKILEGMEKIKSSHDAQVDAINDSLKSDMLTTNEIFALQLDMAKLHLQEELMAKTASKSTQNIDTLLKSQ